MTDKPENQADQILAALKRGLRLTGWQVAADFQCLNLPQRIHDLRRRGIDVKGEYVVTATGKRVMAYFIERPKNNNGNINPLFD